MYLIDTNVFLEILLSQEKSEVAKRFLSSHVDFRKAPYEVKVIFL